MHPSNHSSLSSLEEFHVHMPSSSSAPASPGADTLQPDGRHVSEDEEPMASPTYVCFVTIAILGIVFNTFIIFRRNASRKRGSSTTRLSLSLLSVMAGADSVCLAALLFLLVLRYLNIESATFFTIFCKVNIYTIHAASAFSLYCWLVLSIVRHLAVFSPYTHLRIKREPHLAVIALAVIAALSESWLLIDIEFDPASGECGSASQSQALQIFEILGSYFIPLVIITVCDIRVLFFRSTIWGGVLSGKKHHRGSATPERCSDASDEIENGLPTPKVSMPRRPLSTNYTASTQRSLPTIAFNSSGPLRPIKSKKRAIQFKALRRALLISVFDLTMNLPSYALRLYLIVADDEQKQQFGDALEYIGTISHIMYFAQVQRWLLLLQTYKIVKENRMKMHRERCE